MNWSKTKLILHRVLFSVYLNDEHTPILGINQGKMYLCGYWKKYAPLKPQDDNNRASFAFWPYPLPPSKGICWTEPWCAAFFHGKDQFPGLKSLEKVVFLEITKKTACRETEFKFWTWYCGFYMNYAQHTKFWNKLGTAGMIKSLSCSTSWSVFPSFTLIHLLEPSAARNARNCIDTH